MLGRYAGLGYDEVAIEANKKRTRIIGVSVFAAIFGLILWPTIVKARKAAKKKG